MTQTRKQPALVKISELARLSEVPAPTIKHYIREGLLPGPARRTSRNMAYYDPRLAERVRTIKELQHSHFLPLKLIGDLLEPPPSANLRADVSAEVRSRLGELGPAIRAGLRDSRLRGPTQETTLSRAAVLAKMEITGKELDDLAKIGLAEPTVAEDGTQTYSDADLEIIAIIDEVRRKGMGDLFPMPILKPYAEKVRELVRMELEEFRKRVLNGGGGLPEGPVAEVARGATQLGERMIVAMRTKFLFSEIAVVAQAAPKNGSRPPAKKKTATAAKRPRRGKK